MTFKKPNYENKLWKLKNKQEIIDRHIQELKQYEVLIYGKEDSMFYGLKTPSLYKILEHMCDTYKIPYDVMFDMIYDNIMKIYYKKHIDYIFRPFNWTKSYGSQDEEKTYQNLTALKKPARVKDSLCLGLDYKYRSKSIRTNMLSRISCKGKKHFTDNYENFNKNYHTKCMKTLDKKQIIEQLNKLGIKFRLSDTKEKLMGLLIKNEPSGIVDLSRFD